MTSQEGLDRNYRSGGNNASNDNTGRASFPSSTGNVNKQQLSQADAPNSSHPNVSMYESQRVP